MVFKSHSSTIKTRKERKRWGCFPNDAFALIPFRLRLIKVGFLTLSTNINGSGIKNPSKTLFKYKDHCWIYNFWLSAFHFTLGSSFSWKYNLFLMQTARKWICISFPEALGFRGCNDVTKWHKSSENEFFLRSGCWNCLCSEKICSFICIIVYH